MKILMFLIGFITCCIFHESIALMCYAGQQRWEPPPEINNITLIRCGRNDKCCFMHSSMDGTYYGCYDDCPTDEINSCGPDPKLNIQDVHYCYCKDHLDANCRPYLGPLSTFLKNDPL